MPEQSISALSQPFTFNRNFNSKEISMRSLLLFLIGIPIPVIILSTEGKDEDVRRGLESGARAYLPKPFTSTQLGEVIGRVMKAV